jgi:hypothetical protein
MKMARVLLMMAYAIIGHGGGRGGHVGGGGGVRGDIFIYMDRSPHPPAAVFLIYNTCGWGKRKSHRGR